MNIEARNKEYSSWMEEKERLNKITEFLEAHGIKVKAGSRIYRYQRLLSALENERFEDLPSNFRLKQLYQVAIEIYQLFNAVIELKESKSIQGWKKKLRLISSGRELPENDSNYLSRNHQFELYIAGLLMKSGIEPLCQEPDIVVKWKEGAFGLAIKRPNSSRKMDENLRRARNQIIKTDHNGIILIDMSLLYNPANRIIKAAIIDEVTDQLIQALEQFFQENYYPMKNTVDNERVIGIVLHVACLCDIKGQAGHASRFTVKNFCSEESPKIKHLDFLANRLKETL